LCAFLADRQQSGAQGDPAEHIVSTSLRRTAAGALRVYFDA